MVDPRSNDNFLPLIGLIGLIRIPGTVDRDKIVFSLESLTDVRFRDVNKRASRVMEFDADSVFQRLASSGPEIEIYSFDCADSGSTIHVAVQSERFEAPLEVYSSPDDAHIDVFRCTRTLASALDVTCSFEATYEHQCRITSEAVDDFDVTQLGGELVDEVGADGINERLESAIADWAESWSLDVDCRELLNCVLEHVALFGMNGKIYVETEQYKSYLRQFVFVRDDWITRILLQKKY